MFDVVAWVSSAFILTERTVWTRKDGIPSRRRRGKREPDANPIASWVFLGVDACNRSNQLEGCREWWSNAHHGCRNDHDPRAALSRRARPTRRRSARRSDYSGPDRYVGPAAATVVSHAADAQLSAADSSAAELADGRDAERGRRSVAQGDARGAARDRAPILRPSESAHPLGTERLGPSPRSSGSRVGAQRSVRRCSRRKQLATHAQHAAHARCHRGAARR